MQDKKRKDFSDGYLEQLRSISNVHFTSREIDIIACLLNARGTSRIASFLAISPKTVANHIHNVMVKLDCNSREGIIDFIEKSNKQSFLRAHYSYLTLEDSFKSTLKAIAKLRHKNFPCSLIYWKTQENSRGFLEKLRDHLELAAVKTHLEMRNTESTITHLKNENKDGNYRLYVMPVSICNVEHPGSLEKLTTDPAQISSKCLFLFIGKTNLEIVPHEVCGVEYIDFTEQANYYFSVFEILKKFFPNANLEKLIIEFKQQYELTNESPTMAIPQERLSIKKELPSLPRIQSFLKERKWSLLIGCITVISVLSIGFFTFKEGKEKELMIADSSSKPQKPSIRSDLILPSKTTLLDRPELLTQIENKFKNQAGIQTIAIIGIGGSGKTTTARHYAHQQKANIIWEINAETNTSLMESFANLAQALSKTEEDKKILRELEEIKYSVERGKKLIEFVKERLKLQSNWFLIYDNVEDFKKVKKYFPTDINTWGEGRVILTTRNHNIQNSRQVDGIILMEGLNPKQKLVLFMQILNHEENKKLTVFQKEELKGFLEKIPPFPLDISVAAYYLKTTNSSYSKYLECLNQQDTNFTAVQENILKEAGEYTKTRNSIIILALNQLMNAHKNFKDLLLLISLLDSQNIPRALLDSYQEKAVVDNFIYHLKKYSLIIHESQSDLFSTFSVHRSIQAITLNYLTKRLNLIKNLQLKKQLNNILDNYLNEIIDKENFVAMKIMERHCQKYLSYKDRYGLFTISHIESKLGCMFYYRGFYPEAKQFLENSINVLNKSYTKYYAQIAFSLVYLANTYRETGDFETTIKLLKKSLIIYEEHFPETHAETARTLGYLAYAYRNIGHYKKAKSLLERSLTINKKIFPSSHIKIAWGLVHLGIIERLQGNLEKARNFIEKSLLIYEKNIGTTHPKYAWALVNLGVVDREQGNLHSARELLEKSLVIYRRHFFETHIPFIWASAHLGNVYRDLGDYNKAKALFTKSLLIYEKNFGKEHLETARILTDFAQTYCLEGNLMAAEKLINKAYKIFQKSNHPEIFTCLEIFAGLQLKKSQEFAHKNAMKDAQYFKIQAINNLKQALDVVKAHFPENSPHIIRIHTKIKRLEEG